LQCSAHLFGDGVIKIFEDLELDGIAPHYGILAAVRRWSLVVSGPVSLPRRQYFPIVAYECERWASEDDQRLTTNFAYRCKNLLTLC
jgi:hypothetical protein